MNTIQKKAITVITMLLVLALDTSAQQVVDLASVKNKPSLLSDQDVRVRIIEVIDSLRGIKEYDAVSRYVSGIDPLITTTQNKALSVFKAKLLVKSARAQARLQNVTKVYELLKKAEAIYTTSHEQDSIFSADLYGLLSNTTRRLGLYEDALHYGQLWLPLVDEEKDPLEKAEVYNTIGLAHARLFNKKSALEYYKKCYALRERVAPEWLPFSMNNMGELYDRIGSYDSATYWYKKAYHFRHPNLGKDIFIHSILLLNLSEIYDRRMQYDSALWSIEEALRIRGKFEGITSPIFQQILLQKTKILLEMEELGKSVAMLDSLEKYRKPGNHPEYDNRFFRRKANYMSKIHQFDSAIYYTNEALYSLDTNFYFQHRDQVINYTPPYPDTQLITTLKNKANLYFQRFKATKEEAILKLALHNMSKAVECMNRFIYRQPNIIADPEIYGNLKNLVSAHLEMMEAAKLMSPKSVSPALVTELLETERMHSVKKLLLYEQLLSGDSANSALLKKRHLLYNRLQDNQRKNGNKQEYDSLFMAADKLEAQLKNEMGKLYPLKLQETYKLDPDYLQLLPTNSALVQYFFADSTLHCIYTTKTRFEWYKIDWGTAEDNLLRAALAMLKDPANDNYSLLTQLGTKLLPFLDSFEEKHLLIMPNGLLHHLPFEALMVNHDYLVSSHTISYLEALSWPKGKKDNSFNEGFLGFAPFTVANTEKSSSSYLPARNSGIRLKPLPQSLSEVKQAASYFSSKILTDEKATETALKSNSVNLKVIHFATHALMKDDDALNNSIILAGDSVNDGIVHTYELIHLQIQAELAILSACNTGNGTNIQGEGIIGLSTGFYTAGLNNLIFTLWSVPDKQSADLLKKFYQYWQKQGQSMPEALRSAKLAYLENADKINRHPYFWASIVMHQKELQVDSEKSTQYWWLLVLFPAVAAIFLAFRIKRKQSIMHWS